MVPVTAKAIKMTPATILNTRSMPPTFAFMMFPFRQAMNQKPLDITIMRFRLMQIKH
jgi:hypothetical protein